MDPAATAFFGIDRTTDISRLGGLRFAGNGGPIRETLQLAMAFAYQEGAAPDTIFLNPIDMQNLLVDLGSQTFWDRKTAPDAPSVGFDGVKIVSVNGTATAFADPGCPKGRAMVLQMDTWKLYTLGDFPGYLSDDGLTLLRETGADQYTWRMGGYGNLVCTAPGYNMNIAL